LETAGIHCIAEMYGCPRHLLNDQNFVCGALRDAAASGMATLLKEVSHQFQPQGVTALGLLAESHISIHTWPEFGYVGADVFTCGDRASAVKACEYLVKAFQPERHSLKKIDRGVELAESRPDLHNQTPVKSDRYATPATSGV
jgi:S-adenosylmethionine decarboxylase